MEIKMKSLACGTITIAAGAAGAIYGYTHIDPSADNEYGFNITSLVIGVIGALVAVVGCCVCCKGFQNKQKEHYRGPIVDRSQGGRQVDYGSINSLFGGPGSPQFTVIDGNRY